MNVAAEYLMEGDLSGLEEASARIAFIGQPNTGKSTFFNRVTKAQAGVANWPGLTVDLQRAVVDLGDEDIEFVDLPGIYDLDGFTEDEAVVQRFLEQNPVNMVVLVLNATQIDRQIRIALQVKALGVPAVVALNMVDEARRYGVQIDAKVLSQRLGMPVHGISAKYGEGVHEAVDGIVAQVSSHPQAFQVRAVAECMRNKPVTDALCASTLDGAVTMPPLDNMTLTTQIDRVLLHPLLGLPVFFAIMLAVFAFIWFVGIPTADPVAAVTDWLLEHAIQPAITWMPEMAQGLIVDGIWNGFATLASFVPLVALFMIVMGFLEGSGYLSRAAYLMDALMRRLGLDGRTFVLQIMGFGCNVPAIMGTRVMRSRMARFAAILIIPLSLCSARLQVFIFILAAVTAGMEGAIILFILYVASFVFAFLIAAVGNLTGLLRNREPFVLELPPYRVPTAKQVLLKVWGEMKEFISRLTLFMILGASLMWFLTTYPEGAEGLETYAGQIGSFMKPVMEPIGINPFMSVSLLFGFVAKEVQIAGLAVAYGLSDHALQLKLGEILNFGQALSFCLFSLLYTPCLTTLATIWGETKSATFTALTVIVPLIVAYFASLALYQGWLAFTAAA
jgi:ferrous iron transport protein B